MNLVTRSSPSLSRNVRRLGHLDLPGAGQVCIAGHHAYVGHIPNKDHLGTSVVDISDPRNPRLVASITLDDHDSHSHKARVVGDIMIVNHERNPTAIGRRADELPRVRGELSAVLGREPTCAELAAKLEVTETDIVAIEAEAERRLPQWRLQDLRRIQSCQAERNRASENRRHRRPSLRYG